MSKKVFLKVSIISIALLLAIGLLICSNTMADNWEWEREWERGSQNYGGWGFFNSRDSWNSGFGNGYFWPRSSSKKVRRWAGWNNDGWEEFIEKLKEKYHDLEGIKWDDYEDWDEADWNAFRKALQEMRLEESLENYIEDITEKFGKYDDDDWETFNTNFFAFISVADDDQTTDIELTWAGFVATYGCFDAAKNNNQLIDCWKDYDTWTDDQWADFRGIYCEYSKYEWEQFNKELQERLEDYYDELADWEDWRDWTDEEWESYLDKYSDFTTSTSTGGHDFGSPFGGPGGSSYGSPAYFGFGSYGGYDFGSPFGGWGGSSYGTPAYFGFGSPFGNLSGYNYVSSACFGFGGFNNYSFCNQGGYGYSGQGRYGFPGGYGFPSLGDRYGFPKYGYSGSLGDNGWW